MWEGNGLGMGEGKKWGRWGKGGSDKMQLMLVSILTLKPGINIYTNRL